MKQYNPKHFFVVGAHGTYDAEKNVFHVVDNRRRRRRYLTPQELAQIIVYSGIKEGEVVLLALCESDAGEAFELYVQQLADALRELTEGKNMVVVAPAGYLRLIKFRTTDVISIVEDGGWEPYVGREN